MFDPAPAHTGWRRDPPSYGLGKRTPLGVRSAHSDAGAGQGSREPRESRLHSSAYRTCLRMLPSYCRSDSLAMAESHPFLCGGPQYYEAGVDRPCQKTQSGKARAGREDHVANWHGNCRRVGSRSADLGRSSPRVSDLDDRKSRVSDLKFFGGMTTEEIGLVLGISVATVRRELRLGQAWLRRETCRDEA